MQPLYSLTKAGKMYVPFESLPQNQNLMSGYLITFIMLFSQEIPTDKTGDFDLIYDFLKEHWNIVRWVALGAVVFEVCIFDLPVLNGIKVSFM